MNSTLLFVLVLGLASSCLFASILPLHDDYPPFQFARHYTIQDLYTSESVRDQFIADAFKWEAFFHTEGVGVNLTLGLTYDGTAIDPYTGLPAVGGLHSFSAPSKEFVHLSIIAWALNGSAHAQQFFSQSAAGGDILSHILDLLDRKLNSYALFDSSYPGYAGFLPWFAIDPSTGALGPTADWATRVPGLDNGEWLWGLYAVRTTLLSGPNAHDARVKPLTEKLTAKLTQLTTNLQLVFLNETGAFYRAETRIADTKQPPGPQQYTDNVPGYCLDDPYEGELLVMYCDLFCDWQDPTLRERIWLNKRPKLQAVLFRSQSGSESAPVQRGFWYSAHEVWKLWSLPYMQTSIRRAFADGEAARTIYSAENRIPGMRASVSGVMGSCGDAGYVGDCGIQALASQLVLCLDIVTPYSATPLMLFTREFAGAGIAWYATMLNGSRMQGPYGATEASNINGTNIAPVLTWDVKGSSLLGMLGGAAPLTEAGLAADGKLNRFLNVIEREYGRVFPEPATAPLQAVLPTVVLPNYGGFKL